MILYMSALRTAQIKQMRKCRNWQTSKTKDLVAFVPCGFKSHLPHLGFFRRTGEALSYIAAGVAEWQTRRLQVPVVARLCGFKSHLLHVKRTCLAGASS